jgi:predicted HAD superfamily hydrolase
MDIVSTPAKKGLLAGKKEVFPDELLDSFNTYAPKIKMLSLDCFDTVLWRKTATPKDVFYDLQQTPAFKALNFSASMRVAAEMKARKLRFIQERIAEVTLHQIYSASYPELSAQTLTELAAAELAMEVANCYAFPPIVELIRAAAAKRIKIIIVSDTYFQEKELRQLLSAHLPADAMAAISAIYCSCELGKSKFDGMFKKIISKTRFAPKAILHVGDSLMSDFHAAQKESLHALRLLQQTPAVEQILSLQNISANYMDGEIRHHRALASPFHGILAASHLQDALPETLLGFVALGPLLYVFAKFILAKITELENAGKKPKVLFLLRDGYLPSLVCDAVANKIVGHQVRISRFVALAASFRTAHDVDTYLSEVAQTLRFNDIARQLLLPEAIANKVIDAATQAGNSSGFEFIRQIQQPDILAIIYQQSAAYRQRLQKHLTKAANLTEGDTLLLIDLGYTGTAQNLLTPVFRDELAVEMTGCYLLSLRTPGWEQNRSGLLDPSWCDDRLLLTLISYIALLEQVCTSNDKSVVDFDETGEPVFSTTGTSKKQQHQINRLQTECVRFAKEAEAFLKTTQLTFTTQELRDTALAHLSRLIFLPTQSELDYLESIEFDLNLGTDDLLRVFDQEAGLQGLRRRGVFFMERNAKTMRTNYPAELRNAGFELSLLLLAQHRFGLDISRKELSLRREAIPVIIIAGEQATRSEINAMPTYDGFFAMIIPLGEGGFQIGVQFGLPYQWLQIESIELIKAKAMFKENESMHTQEIWDQIVFDKMVEKNQHLFECLDPSALLMFLNAPASDKHHYVLRIVFRPLVKRPKTLAEPTA